MFTPQASKPRLRIQFFQRPVHRFDFVDVIVLFNAFNALFPQFAVACFLPGGAFGSAVHFQVELEFVR
ncbi:Uncharacterised protein [Shigella flexneri]|nr:Uncharacterised protein [Shigella flexneri]